jgi:hypothetical protein
MQFIQELGLSGYLEKYPVNPISIVGLMVIIGILVLSINACAKMGKPSKYQVINPNAAIMTFHKKEIGNNDYADNIRIVKLNGKIPRWFFIKPSIPAIFLKLGKNDIELYAEWAIRGSGRKMFKSDVISMSITAEEKGRYSLEYHIPEERYIFEPFEL